MKRNNSIISKLFMLMLALTVSFTGAMMPQTGWAANSTHYIAVASDRHNNSEAIGIAMKKMPTSVEYVCLNGDMTDFAASGSGDGEPPSSGSVRKQMAYNTSTVLGEVQAVFPKLTSENVSIEYGSHDANATDDAGIMKCADTSLLPSENAADKNEISQGRSGLIYTGYDGNTPAYYVYGVSYYDMMNPGDTAEESTGELPEGGKKSSEAFMKFADENPGVPIIAVGHVPVHAKRGDNLAASYWNDALNHAAVDLDGNPRDVVYLHGHNHTSEKTEYFLLPGDTMKVQGTSRKESIDSVISYTYVTAGYLRDNHTATLVAVKDGRLSIKKYYGNKPDAPELISVSVNPAKKKAVVKWKAADDATDYRVAYKKASSENWTRKWSNGTASYTITGLSSKGLYDINVVSAKESDNTFNYSDASVTSHKYIASVSGVKAKASKKTVKLSWKKDSNAAAYKIKYAANKSMKNAKLITVSGGKSSYTVKGLKKGKTYYFKVCPVVKQDGTSYTGVYSTRMSVKL